MSETIYNLTIDEAKFVNQETSVLSGELKAFIVAADRPVQLMITIKDNPGIRVLELQNFQGDKYMCVRTPANDYKGDQYNYQVEEISLNDALVIQAQGMSGTKIQVKIRMED